LLTGKEAGEPQTDGSYPEGSFNQAVVQGLESLAEAGKEPEEETPKEEMDEKEADDTEESMLELAIMVEGQNGLNWERWQRLAQAVEALGFCGPVPLGSLHQRQSARPGLAGAMGLPDLAGKPHTAHPVRTTCDAGILPPPDPDSSHGCRGR